MANKSASLTYLVQQGEPVVNQDRLGTFCFIGPCSAPLQGNGSPDPTQLPEFNAYPSSGGAYQISKKTNLEEVLGSGPLVDALRKWQAEVQSDDALALAVPCEKTVAGSAGSVTASGSASYSPTKVVQAVSSGGTAGPWRSGDIVVECTYAGTPNASIAPKVKVSYDGGVTFPDAEVAIRADSTTYDLTDTVAAVNPAFQFDGADTTYTGTQKETRPTITGSTGSPSYPLDMSAGAYDVTIEVVEAEDGAAVEYVLDCTDSSVADIDEVAAEYNIQIAAASGGDGDDHLECLVVGGNLVFRSKHGGTDASVEITSTGGSVTTDFGLSAAAATTVTNVGKWIEDPTAATAAEVADHLENLSYSASLPTGDQAPVFTSIGNKVYVYGDESVKYTGDAAWSTLLGWDRDEWVTSLGELDRNGAGSTLHLKGMGLALVFQDSTALAVGNKWTVSCTAAQSAVGSSSTGWVKALRWAKEARAAKPFEGFVFVGQLPAGSSPSSYLTACQTIETEMATLRSDSFHAHAVIEGPAYSPVNPQTALTYAQANADIHALSGQTFDFVSMVAGTEVYYDVTYGYVASSLLPGIVARAVNLGRDINLSIANTRRFGSPLNGYQNNETYPVAMRKDAAKILIEDLNLLTARQLPNLAAGVYPDGDASLGDPTKAIDNLRGVRIVTHVMYLVGIELANRVHMTNSPSAIAQQEALIAASIINKMNGSGANARTVLRSLSVDVVDNGDKTADVNVEVNYDSTIAQFTAKIFATEG